MKTFVNVNLALLPLAIFSLLLARGMPAVAIYAGLIASVAVCAWRGYRRDIKTLELAILVIFGNLALGVVLFPDVVATSAITFAFIGLGVFAVVTVLLRRPWTADFSRAAYTNEAGNPVFTAVNMVVSGIWGALFLLLALASAVKAGFAVTIAIVVFGSAISILARNG